ncbi:MAG: hypothetical protein QXG00_03285 [Candidatus Woesearchaeota archaeon]
MKIKKIEIKNIVAWILVLVVFLFLLKNISALPQAPFITTSSVNTGPNISTYREDAGGTITTLVLNTNQQNDAWKGYVGNITGTLSLMDSLNFTLYDWSITSFTGEVYATTNNTVNWLTVACSDYTIISNQYSSLNMAESDVDSINKTFNNTIHATFSVGAVQIANSTCKSISTYVNSSKQTISEDMNFQEVLLTDTVNLIYASLLEINERGYNNETFDFQMIVPDTDSGALTTTYYFFVELTK